MNQPLDESFFQQSAEALAKALLGAILVRKVGRVVRRARLIETEAYVGTHDLASHASKGKTRRTAVMFGPAGRAYVYFIYGMHQMLNIVSLPPKEGDAGAVLLRAAEPLDGWDADLTGPGRLARAYNITAADNGVSITGDDLHLLADPTYKPRIKRSKRVGVGYARHWQHRLLRFIDVASPLAVRLKR
jgi:DNA-3-methyladenine glycosylase